jgi:hypothetical protein
MADFSVIAQTPVVRALVQENLLQRAFHDSLFPRMLFRGEAEVSEWNGNLGDTMIFSGVGLMPKSAKPLAPTEDPLPQSFSAEQWAAQLNLYAGTIDTHMPTSANAIADLFLRNAQQLGLMAAQSVNTLARDRMFNAALSGTTVHDSASPVTGTSIAVKRLNGLTKARRPGVSGASQVRFEAVSPGNPLPVLLWDGSAYVSRNIVGYTSVVAGDEVGPGTITLSASATVAARGPILSYDRSVQVYADATATDTIDSLTALDVLTFKQIRSAVSRFRIQNVPEFADGTFHMHLDPVSESQLYDTVEFQRLNTSIPDYYMYKQFAIGTLLGVSFFRNTECPLPETVTGGGTSNATESFSQEDPFGGEIWNASDLKVHRALLVGQKGLHEYYQNPSLYLSDAGLNGKMGNFSITNNGIEVFADRISLVLRAPLNRLQDQVTATYKFVGDFVVRTDAAVGDSARYKRVCAINHIGE